MPFENYRFGFFVGNYLETGVQRSADDDTRMLTFSVLMRFVVGRFKLASEDVLTRAQSERQIRAIHSSILSL